MTSRSLRRQLRSLSAATLAAAALVLGIGGVVQAHGFTSNAYVSLSQSGDAVVADFDLEYDLLVVSAAENIEDPAFFEDGMAVFETGDEASALEKHSDTVVTYVTERFRVSAGEEVCEPRLVGGYTSQIREDVPYAGFTLEYACPATADQDYTVASTLFADDEGYVTGATTLLEYELGDDVGSAALTGSQTFSTEQPWFERFVEFFVLGAEHLLFGIDHILFLLALIVGSRRLRDVVLAATAFTVAHSITFLLAALGVVSIPAAIVEPIIALSIAVVALWYLWGVWRRRGHELEPEPEHRGPLKLNGSDWLRLGVVFAFGLIHGVGFAGALGIDEPWSWTLLWSLLVFNVGIEVTQLAIIAVIFPVLLLLRRRVPRVGLWVGIAITVIVAIFGLVWFVERLLGAG